MRHLHISSVSGECQQVFPLSDVKAYMRHTDIATTMIYVHHVPQIDVAEKLSRVLASAGAPDEQRWR